MKRETYLKGLLAFLLLMVGANPSWADDPVNLLRATNISVSAKQSSTELADANKVLSDGTLTLKSLAASELTLTLTFEAVSIDASKCYVIMETSQGIFNTGGSFKTRNITVGSNKFDYSNNADKVTTTYSSHDVILMNPMGNNKATISSVETQLLSYYAAHIDEAMNLTSIGFNIPVSNAGDVIIYRIGIYDLAEIESLYASPAMRFKSGLSNSLRLEFGGTTNKIQVNGNTITLKRDEAAVLLKSLGELTNTFAVDLRGLVISDAATTKPFTKETMANLSNITTANKVLMGTDSYKYFPTSNANIAVLGNQYYQYKEGTLPKTSGDNKTQDGTTARYMSYTGNLAAGYNTLMVPFEVNPDDLTAQGLTAYTLTAATASGALTFTKATSAIAHSTPMIIKAEEAGFYLIPRGTVDNTLPGETNYKNNDYIASTAYNNISFVGSYKKDGVNPDGTYAAGTNSVNYSVGASAFTQMGNTDNISYYRAFLSDKRTDVGTRLVPPTLVEANDGSTITVTLNAASYAITGNPSGGTLAFAVGGNAVTKAEAGQTVTITATPSSGNTLRTLTVTKSGETSVATAYDTTTKKFSFTMPAEAVTVTATFGSESDYPFQVNGLSYASLTDAIAVAPAAAKNEATTETTIIINTDNVEIERVDITSRNVKLVAGEGKNVVIKRKSSYTGVGFVTAQTKEGNTVTGANATLTIEGMTLDGQNVSATSNLIEGGNSGTVVLNNVTIRNNTTTSVQGVIVNKGSGKLTLNGVTFSNCTVPAGRGTVFVGTTGVTLSGNNTFTNCSGHIYIENTNAIKVSGANHTTAIELIIDPTKWTANGTTIVTGATDASKYTLVGGTVRHSLAVSGSNVVVALASVATGNVVNETTNTGYSTLKEAVDAATTGNVILLTASTTETAAITLDKNLTIKPSAADVSILRAASMTGDADAVLFSISKDLADAINVTIGSNDYALTIDGQSVASSKQLAEVGKGTLAFVNTTIKDAVTSNNQGVLCAKNNGTISLNGVTFNGCQATAENAGIVFCGKNDGIQLTGTNTFTGCTGYNFYIENRLRVPAAITIPATAYSVFIKPKDATSLNIAVGSPVVCYTTPAHFNTAHFEVKNPGYRVASTMSGNDLKLEKIPYTVSLATTITGGTVELSKDGSNFSASLSDITIGESITIKASPAGTNLLTGLPTATYGTPSTSLTVTASATAGKYTFEMPAGNVTVGATFTAKATGKVVNETQNLGYATFKEAYDGAASGDVLILNENVEITERIGSVKVGDVTTKKSLTIKPGAAGVTLTRGAEATGMLFNADGVTLNIGSADYQLTIDGNNVSSSAGLFELGQTTSSILTLTNVVVKNVKTTSANGIINVKKGSGGVTLTDVTFKDNTVTNALIRTLDVNTGGMTFGGAFTVSGGTGDFIRLGSGAKLDASTLPAMTTYNIEVEDASPTITNASTPDKFVLTTVGIKKIVAGTTITFESLDSGQDTAIDESTIAATYGDGYKLKPVEVTADGWVREDTDKGNGTNGNMEVKTLDGKNFYGFIKLVLPTDATVADADIKKAQIRFVTDVYQGSGWFNIYGFTGDYTESSKYSDLSAAITSTLATTPLKSVQVNGQKTKSVSGDTGINEDMKTIDKWTNLVDLTDYVKDRKTAGTLTLMLVASTSEDVKNAFFTREASDINNTNSSITVGKANLIPQLNLVYKAGEVALNVTHPAMLHTAADLARVKSNIGLSPVKDAYAHLQASTYAQASYTPSPVQYLKRMDATNWSGTYSDYANYTSAMKDAHAAYQLALRYQLEGSTACADAAVKILNAWASTNKGVLKLSGYTNEIPDPNEYLISIQAHQFANAAELLREYSGWNATDFTAFKAWIKKSFVDDLALPFLQNHHNHVGDKHYWLNWDLAALTSVLSVGILCDDKDLTDYAIDYYKGTVTTTTGHTNKEEVGYYANAIPFVHADDTTIGLGQCQESGRDQGHSLLDVGLLGAFCQMAKNMGTDGADLFAVDDYRALKMAEYVGKYNLNLDVPFTAYNPNAEYNHTAISAEGRGEVRPVWELFYRYAREAGKSASYSQQWAEKLREANAWGEGGGGDYGTASTGFDQLGYGTLMYADPDDDGQDTKIDENAYKDYTIGKRGTQGDTYVRSDNATSKNGTAAQMEIRSNETADFMGLLSFKLPADAVGTVQKAQLRLVTKRKQISRNINIYAYNDFDEASATYTTETSHITTAKKTTPLTGFTPKGQSGLDVTSGGKTMTDANKKLEAWTNYVDLTAYVKELKTRNVNLLLADAGVGTNNNSVQFFTKEQGSLTLDSEGKVAFASEAADLVPQLVVVYTESSTTKTFEVEGEGFATLEDALAEVADGGTILVKGDALVESQVKFDKNVTIKAADGVTPVLKRDATDKVLYLMGSNKTVTFENIIFDENGATDKPLMEINNSQKFVLNNVTIQNSKYKNSDGLLDVKNGTLILNGVTFKDCAVTYAYIRTAKAEGGGLDFAGKVNFTNSTGDHLLLRGKASVDGSKLLSAITAPITVDINASDYSTLSITNVTDLSKFQLTTDGFTMSLNNGTVTFVKEDDGQDVDDLSKYTGTNSSKSPNADTFVRSTSAETKYGTANNIEVHTNADADFAGLLSFRLPGNAVADGAEIQKVQLRLVTKQKKSNGGINIFRFCDFEEGTATYKTTSDSVAAARKSTAITKFYPKGQTGMDVTSDGSKESFDASYKKIASWENRIDLTAYVKGLKSRTVNLLLSASSDDGQTIQFFSKEWKTALSTAATSDGTASNHAFDASVDELIPQLIVIYQGNGKTNTFVIPDEGSYATLEEALEDVEDGGTILVTANATIGDQISFTKNVTIKSDGNSARILTRGSGAKSVLYKMDKSVTVNFENLIFNENGFTDKPLIEVSGNQHFVLKDVTIQNSNYKNSDGLLDVKDGSLTLDNVTFKDCEVANAFIRTAKANGGGLEFASRLNFVNCTGDHILLRAKASVDGSRLLSAITAPVMVEINGSDYSNLSITNVSDLSKFELMTIGYSMVLRGTTIYFEEESDGQDTEEIEVPEDAELVTVSSLGDTYLRKGNTTDNGKKTTIEVYTYEDGSSDLDFVGLMAFKLPSDLLVEGAVLHKAQLRLVSKRVKGSPIIDMYDLYRDFDESAIYDNMESVVEELRSKERMHRFHARGMAGMDIEADTLKLTEKYKDINEWTNLIDLTGWVDNARYDDGKIRFALMSPLNSKDAKMFYTKEATAIKNSVMTVSKDSLVPQLTLVYTPGTGASTLSAKNIEATPNADTFVRKGSTNDNSVSTCIEVYTYKTDRADIDFVGLLSFDLNDDVQRARSRAKTDELELFSATLRLVTKRVRGERDMNVYVFDEPFSGNSTYDELADAIAKTRADADYVTFKTAGQEGKDITTDSGLTGTYKTSIVPWTNEIDMTGILKGSDTSTLSLMLSAPDNGRSSKQYFSSEAESFTNDNNKDFIVAPEDLVPQLVISYRNPYYTDIEETVIIPVSKTEIIYDLRGNRVETMGKGIYIVNGKKVLKK